MTILLCNKLYKHLKQNNQQMGNLCQVHSDEPTVYNNGERPISSTMRITSIYLDDSQNEKINEIKEFLTLTSQNAQSFYDADHPDCR